MSTVHLPGDIESCLPWKLRWLFAYETIYFCSWSTMVWKALDPEPSINLYKSLFILDETQLFSITYFSWIILVSKGFGMSPMNNFFLTSLVTSVCVLNTSPNDLSFFSFHRLPPPIPHIETPLPPSLPKSLPNAGCFTQSLCLECYPPEGLFYKKITLSVTTHIQSITSLSQFTI